MTKLLFLGDSITDSNRLFSNQPLGCGYVHSIAQKLYHLGYEITITNRGVDGFTISRLLENCESQYISIDADVTVILIGINDIGLMMNTDRTSKQQQDMMNAFLLNYEKLLLSLPHTQFILMEPFIFPYPSEFRHWFPFIRQMSDGISALAANLHIPYIHLHDDLNHYAQTYGLDAVTTDGIHLTTCGHEIIAEKLLHTLKTYV